MTWFRVLALRFRAIIKKRHLDRQLEEELQGHLTMLIDDNCRRGMSTEEARRAARLALGGTEQIKVAVSEQRGMPLLETFVADLRFGARTLKRNPGFAAVAVLTLALGIGANTAIFSLLDAALLQPLPYRDPGRLIWVTQYAPRLDSTLVPAGTFLVWREQNRSFEDFAAYLDHLCDGNLSTGTEPVRLDRCAEVSASFFSVLGIRPALGRSFLPKEDNPGARGVMILSDGFWRRRFGANPNVLGKTIQLDGAEYTVIGILPASFEHPGELRPDAFVPLALPSKPDWSERESDEMGVIGRLKPGVTIEQARTELQTLTQPLGKEYPQKVAERLAGSEVQAISLHDRLVGDTRPALVVLMGAVGLVLLIACVNVANLLLARAVARQKEFSVRAALGAGRLRIIRQLLTEGALLAGFGSAAGLLVASGTMNLVRALRPATFVHFEGMHLNGAALVFTLVVSLGTGVLFSLAPALLVSRADLNDPLREAGGRATAGAARQRLGDALVAFELALAFLLLIGAGLLIRSFANLRAVNSGFDPRNVLTVQVTLTEAKYRQPAQQTAFFEKLLAGIQSQPGVESVGGTTALPLYYGFSRTAKIILEDRQSGLTDQSPSVPVSRVTPDYFSAMRIPLQAGRFFKAEDREGTLPVAIVSREFTRRFLAINDPIGRHLRFAAAQNAPEQEFTIVGVVGDVRYFGLDRELAPVVFTPARQFPTSALTLAVRSRIAPESLTSAIRSEVQNIDKEQPIYHVATMEQRLADSVGPRRFDALLLGLFASVAVLLAAVGIYGVMSYWVTQRMHEIGVRIALGAQPQQVLELVVGRALRLTVGGLAIGLLGALALTHSLGSLLFGVQPLDTLTFGAASIALTGVALAASFLPALRAALVDPMVALHYG